MLKQIYSFFTATILLTTLLTANIFACACCSEPGMYHHSERKIEQYNLDLLAEMKFAEETNLFMTEAGWEGFKGLEVLEKNYPLESWTSSPLVINSANAFSKNMWKFDLTTKHKKLKGTLHLPLPAKMWDLSADIHDGRKSGGGGPLLYKEWRFNGKVMSGTGFFKNGIDPATTYRLVLQGRGNGCDNAEDFSNWHLTVTGKKADYKFFGKLTSGTNWEIEEVEEEEVVEASK